MAVEKMELAAGQGNVFLDIPFHRTSDEVGIQTTSAVAFRFSMTLLWVEGTTLQIPDMPAG